MVRILVVSDSHGDSRALMRALDEQPDARYILHLGDGVAEYLKGTADGLLGGEVNACQLQLVNGIVASACLEECEIV